MEQREQDIVDRIVERYGPVVDMNRSPGVILEILRDFGPNILRLLDELTDGGGGVSSVATTGGGKDQAPTLEDVFRLVLEVRQEVLLLGQRIAPGR